MIIGVDYYETDKADVRDYKTWNTSCTFRWIYGCVLLHTEGSVFANAQTGNIVLMGCHLISKNLKDSIRYFLPVAFLHWGYLWPV